MNRADGVQGPLRHPQALGELGVGQPGPLWREAVLDRLEQGCLVGVGVSLPQARKDLVQYRGCRATIALPGHPRLHSSTQATGFGIGMTALHGKMTGGCGCDGDGLSVAPRNGCIEAMSSSITARWQANGCLLVSGESLTTFEDVIQSLIRTATVVVRNPHRESQIPSTLTCGRSRLPGRDWFGRPRRCLGGDRYADRWIR